MLRGYIKGYAMVRDKSIDCVLRVMGVGFGCFHGCVSVSVACLQQTQPR